MRKLKRINYDIKIHLALISVYKIKEDLIKSWIKHWKKEFYYILSLFQNKYNFGVFDYKNLEEISSKREYYRDIEHLNYNGATVFTKLLNKDIFKIEVDNKSKLNKV